VPEPEPDTTFDTPFFRRCELAISWGITACCLLTCLMLLAAIISGHCP
jgi:hypothetical protein